MDDKKIEIERVYTINISNDRGSYNNIILSTDVNTQKKLIEIGHTIFGFSEVKCYEYISTIQCLKCCRYGTLLKSAYNKQDAKSVDFHVIQLLVLSTVLTINNSKCKKRLILT